MASLDEYQFENNAESELDAAIGGASLTFSITSGDGALFPSVSAGDGKAFFVLITDGTNSEWFKITQRSGDNFTAESRTGSNSFAAGAQVRLRLNATVLESFKQKGVYREVASSPDGSLAANYDGEEVLDTVAEKWYKHVTSTTWKEIG